MNDLPIPTIRYSDVEEAAKSFLNTYNTQEIIPTPIEEIAELKLGIHFIIVPGIKKLLGIDAYIDGKFEEITIDEFSYSKYIPRTRFSIAHEIGHKVLHSKWFIQRNPESWHDCLNFYEMIDESDYGKLEIQASTFASLVLVPTKLLTKQLIKYLGHQPEQENIETLRPFFTELLENFNVSGEVMVRRLEKEGFVAKNNFLK